MAVDAFLYRQHQAEIGKKIKQKLGGTFNYYVITRNNYYPPSPLLFALVQFWWLPPPSRTFKT